MSKETQNSIVIFMAVICAIIAIGYSAFYNQRISFFQVGTDNRVSITNGNIEFVSGNEQEIEVLQTPVNINEADVEQLMTLPEIGEVTAERIIAYREENGDFKSISDIMDVPGIGEKTYSIIKYSITV